MTACIDLAADQVITVDPERVFDVRYGLVTADARELHGEELELLVVDAAQRLADAPALDILRWASLTFGDRLIVASSMSDGVLAHLVGRIAEGVKVVFLDTGLHFAETIGTRDAIAATLPVHVISATPALSVAEQTKQYGPELWRTDPDRCCALRKVEPLERTLAPYRAWVTGLRADDSTQRADTPVVQYDAKRRMVKINPIVRWRQAEVDAYVARHDVIVNPLQQIGYRSIGCAPCTRPVSADEQARAGRWIGTSKTECGIHT